MILEISFMQFELKHSIPVLKRKSVLFKKTKQKKISLLVVATWNFLAFTFTFTFTL